jgi:hypothetical protein
MKITLDKEYTTETQIPAIKEKMECFKEKFADNDILRMYNEATNSDICGRVVECTVDAYASNSITDNASFYIEIIVYCVAAFHVIRFFMDDNNGDHTVTNKDYLIHHEIFHL